ncbi:hypothetical protein [Clostridium botulinum]|uniref:hypothetical protein n=1 Tax=Clostridium botulinum TaxID=1491 RepID=UPI000773FF88|nr:hypothetical protein [Clostridium botulinum]
MFCKSKQRDNSNLANLRAKNQEVCYCRRPTYERPGLPTPKWEIEMPKDLKPPKQYKNIINISGIDPKDIQALKLELAKSNFENLNGMQVNITEKREKTKVIIIIENIGVVDTISDETVDEINSKLNSNKEFITIGNLNVKRKSVISVSELENKCEDKS